MDCCSAFVGYGEGSADMPSLCYHGGVQRGVGIRRDTEIGLAI